MKTILSWNNHKKLLLTKPEFKVALEKNRVEYEIAKSIIEARIKKGLSQADLAAKLMTKQSVISRVENARTTPTISFLKRLAGALEVKLEISLK